MPNPERMNPVPETIENIPLLHTPEFILSNLGTYTSQEAREFLVQNINRPEVLTFIFDAIVDKLRNSQHGSELGDRLRKDNDFMNILRERYPEVLRSIGREHLFTLMRYGADSKILKQTLSMDSEVPNEYKIYNLTDNDFRVFALKIFQNIAAQNFIKGDKSAAWAMKELPSLAHLLQEKWPELTPEQLLEIIFREPYQGFIQGIKKENSSRYHKMALLYLDFGGQDAEVLNSKIVKNITIARKEEEVYKQVEKETIGMTLEGLQRLRDEVNQELVDTKSPSPMAFNALEYRYRALGRLIFKKF